MKEGGREGGMRKLRREGGRGPGARKRGSERGTMGEGGPEVREERSEEGRELESWRGRDFIIMMMQPHAMRPMPQSRGTTTRAVAGALPGRRPSRV